MPEQRATVHPNINMDTPSKNLIDYRIDLNDDTVISPEMGNFALEQSRPQMGNFVLEQSRPQMNSNQMVLN